MARVSLIVPTVPTDLWNAEPLAAARQTLGDAGHSVEVLVVIESGTSPPSGLSEDAFRLVSSTHPGRAAAAMAGLERCEGEVLILLDPGQGYHSSDLPSVVEPLARGDADLVVASRVVSRAGLSRPDWKSRILGRLARATTGTSDPLSGLIGLTRTAIQGVGDNFHPVGRQFSFEILAKVGGRWIDVPVRATSPSKRSADGPGWDDLRHLKRLADHRFGNFSRLIQYCGVGGSGMVIDLTFYFALQAVFNNTDLINHVVPPTKVTVADTLSRALAIAIALCWNFMLNRRLTFSYARSGSIVRQFIAYVASNGIGVALSLAISLGLPRKIAFFGHHRLAAAVVGIVVATVVSFSMSRWVVFRRHPATNDRAPLSDPDEDVRLDDKAPLYHKNAPVLMDKAG
jgi:dolichol-phosphate mannosyltransferase